MLDTITLNSHCTLILVSALYYNCRHPQPAAKPHTPAIRTMLARFRRGK